MCPPHPCDANVSVGSDVPSSSQHALDLRATSLILVLSLSRTVCPKIDKLLHLNLREGGKFEDRPYLNRSPMPGRNLFRNFDSFVEILGIHHEQAAQLLPGFCKGTVGHNTLALAISNTRGGQGRMQWRCDYLFSACMELFGIFDRLCVALGELLLAKRVFHVIDQKHVLHLDLIYRIERHPSKTTAPDFKLLGRAMAPDVSSVVEEVYRSHWGRIVGTLIRLVGDFDLAEECTQDAFTAAVVQWEASGVPDSPAAWLIQTARHKAIDRIRRRRRYTEKLDCFVASDLFRTVEYPDYNLEDIPDERLRLIFTCCHPALTLEAQVTLTLHTLCGLKIDEIARGFFVHPTTMAQRLVRAKRKIRVAHIPYAVPDLNDMSGRLASVLKVIYLVFNEGYAATRGNTLVRIDLCTEAIRLARSVRSLMQPHPPRELTGLLALMLLHDARRDARYDDAGDLILLEAQRRDLWNRAQIEEGLSLVGEAMRGIPGPFAFQAAIIAEHCRANRAEDTDWQKILRLYDLLECVQPSPVVSLNRAVAVTMVEGPAQGLKAIEPLLEGHCLEDFHLLHSTRADLLRRMGDCIGAATSYRRALALVTNDMERRFLERRLDEVQHSMC
jgi:RNA polymerase sigma-70 factor (ECF subfamily)